MFQNFKNIKILKMKFGWLLLVVIFVLILLRIPSLIEPEWYGDEGVYRVIGLSLSQGRDMYVGAFDNKPPLLFIIYTLFNSDLFWVKLSSLVFGIGALTFLFILAKGLFRKSRAVIISSLFFAIMFGLPVLEGNIANAENFMLVFTILSQMLVFYGVEKRSKFLFFAGVLFSLAFLIKIVAVFDFFASLVFITALYSQAKKPLFLFLPDTKRLLLLAGFLIPVVIIFLYFFLHGTYSLFFDAAFASNISYVDVGNNFIFPLGLLFLKTIFLGIAVLILIIFSKKFKKSELFIYSWVLFALFSVFFSARPYTHYLLMLLPSFSLLVGHIFEKNNKVILSTVLTIIVVYLVLANFKIYKKTASYYQNYLSFVFASKTANDYLYFFDANTPKNYNLAQFVKIKVAKNENIFLWGDDGQIYALSGKLPPGRYSVAYHILFYPNGISDTKKAMDVQKPKLLIRTKDFDEGIILKEGYQLLYIIDGAKIYERQS